MRNEISIKMLRIIPHKDNMHSKINKWDLEKPSYTYVYFVKMKTELFFVLTRRHFRSDVGAGKQLKHRLAYSTVPCAFFTHFL